MTSRHDAKTFGEIERTLDTIRLSGPPLLHELVPQLKELLDAEAACVYRASSTPEGYSLDCFEMLGSTVSSGTARRILEKTLCAKRRFWGCFDPAIPEPPQRNAVIRPRARFPRWEEGPAVSDFYPSVGLVDHDEIRVLVCDDTRLLAWVGGWRTGAHFGVREARLLQALVPALRRRLLVEVRLETFAQVHACLATVLDRLASPALIVSRHHTICHANLLGKGLLVRDRAGVGEAIRALVGGAPLPPGYVGTRVAGNGEPECFLMFEAGTLPAKGRLELAQRRFGLTSMQTRVLSLLAKGMANKEIAVDLRSSVRTVESHVSALMRKMGVDRRAALVALLWDSRNTCLGVDQP